MGGDFTSKFKLNKLKVIFSKVFKKQDLKIQ